MAGRSRGAARWAGGTPTPAILLPVGYCNSCWQVECSHRTLLQKTSFFQVYCKAFLAKGFASARFCATMITTQIVGTARTERQDAAQRNQLRYIFSGWTTSEHG